MRAAVTIADSKHYIWTSASTRTFFEGIDAMEDAEVSQFELSTELWAAEDYAVAAEMIPNDIGSERGQRIGQMLRERGDATQRFLDRLQAGVFVVLVCTVCVDLVLLNTVDAHWIWAARSGR